MNYGRHKWSHFFLSTGLGVVFLWIGIDILRHPDAWLGFLPGNIPLGISRETALQLGGAFDTVLGAILIMRWWPKITATLAALHLAGIIAIHGLDGVLIRDVGLLGCALALLSWPKRHHRSYGS